jgi:tetratricopeptide (TPR) repeat protein
VATDFRFQVAFSFAGDGKRDVVRAVAELVRSSVGAGRVFFDEWFEEELAGHDAQIVLQTIYMRHTLLVVACICDQYDSKSWTREEWRAIQAFERTLRDAGTINSERLRLLPLGFGDGTADGLLETAIVPDVRDRSVAEIADLILSRLELYKQRAAHTGAESTGRQESRHGRDGAETKRLGRPKLEWPRRPDDPPPRQLPDRPVAGALFGREEECRELRELLGRSEIAFVRGPAGIGKSALAGEVVRAIIGDTEASLKASRFADGVVLLDLYRLKARSIDAWNALADALIGTEYAQAPADQRARLACRNRRMLIIVEGAEEADGREGRCDITELLSVCDPLNRRLILTRDLKQIRPGHVVQVEVALNPRAALELFTSIAGEQLEEQVCDELLALLRGHPLALTWAASLLANSGENPRQWLADWKASGWTGLSDPTKPEHTLRWLFGRSVHRLNANEQTVLATAGVLAHMEFPLTAIVAAVGGSRESRSALARLVQLGLLRLSPQPDPERDRWHFTHVLGYQFCREAVAGSLVEVRDRLAGWAHAELTECLSQGDPLRIREMLFQTGALLGMDDNQSQFSLANFCLYDVVDRVGNLGQLGLVDLTLRTVAEWMTRLSADARKEAFWRRESGVVLDRLGDLRQAQGDLVAALRSYTERKDIAEELARSDPSKAAWQRDLSVSHNKVGDLQQAQGDLAAALRSYTEGQTIREKLAGSDPTNAEWQRDLSVTYGRLGTVQQAQGDLAAALHSYTESRTIGEKLARSDPTNAAWQRDLSVSHNKLGDVQQAQGDLAAALRSYTEAQTIREKLAGSDPTNAAWQRDLSVSHNKVGELQQAQGDLAAALHSYTESRTIREKLARSDPTNAAWQRDLSVSHNKVGELQQAQGDLAAALHSHTEGKDISEKLAHSDPTNTAWQRDLSVSYDKLGNLQQAQGDLTAALRSYTEGKNIAEKLARSDPTNAAWQRDVSYLLTVLAQLEAQRGDIAQALQWAQDSLTIDERLAQLDPTNAIWREDVAVSQNLVSRLRASMNDPTGEA